MAIEWENDLDPAWHDGIKLAQSATAEYAI